MAAAPRQSFGMQACNAFSTNAWYLKAPHTFDLSSGGRRNALGFEPLASYEYNGFTISRLLHLDLYHAHLEYQVEAFTRRF